MHTLPAFYAKWMIVSFKLIRSEAQLTRAIYDENNSNTNAHEAQLSRSLSFSISLALWLSACQTFWFELIYCGIRLGATVGNFHGHKNEIANLTTLIDSGVPSVTLSINQIELNCVIFAPHFIHFPNIKTLKIRIWLIGKVGSVWNFRNSIFDFCT